MLKKISICNTLVLSILLFLNATTTKAQFVDNFTNRVYFSDAPAWQGDTSYFKFSNGYLELDHSLANDTTVPTKTVSVISKYNLPSNDTIKVGFNVKFPSPSGNNYFEVVIWSDSTDLENAANTLYYYVDYSNKRGYLMQVVNNSASVILCDTNATYSSGLNYRTIKITKYPDRIIYSNGTDTFTVSNTIQSAIDFTSSNGYFGYLVHSTNSYYSRFFLDNIKVEALIPDVIPPVLSSANFASSDEGNDYITVYFDEDVDSVSAKNTNNYTMLSANIAEQNPVRISYSGNYVTLTYSPNLRYGVLHQLRVCNIKDLAGNRMTSCDTVYVKRYSTDRTSPKATSAAARDVNTLNITFSETVDSISATKLENYSVGGVNPTSAVYKRSQVILTFNLVWEEFVQYNVNVENITDISANKMQATNLNFIFDTSYRNLIINEVLFNPVPQGGDFVEIYNKSDSAISLSEIILANWDETNNCIKYSTTISDTLSIAPHDYFVVTTDTALTRRFIVCKPENVVYLKSMPSYNDGSGTVIIALKDSTIIDRFDYTSKMHNTFLNDEEGVSLERCSFSVATQIAANWHSASKASGYATPTCKNSQNYDFLFGEEDIVVDPEIFSPDNDDYNDLLNITYKFDNCDYNGNIFIYDAQGRLVKRLERNAILGCSGVFNWNGLNEAGVHAQIGNYIVYMEVFDTKGNKQSFKKVVTLMLK